MANLTPKHKIGIYYDQSGLDDIMTGHEMEEMERSIMLQKKSEIEAAFLQTFGVPGNFKFEVIRSSHNRKWGKGYHGNRVIYRILPDSNMDKGRTSAILKAHPGWIDQFV